MLLIQRISTDPYQRQTILLEDGSAVSITLYYVPLQFGWFITELVYAPKAFTLRGLRICNSPNILHQWKNILPFEIGCFTEGGREPTQLEDFDSGAAKLYILTSAEIDEWAEYLLSGT